MTQKPLTQVDLRELEGKVKPSPEPPLTDQEWERIVGQVRTGHCLLRPDLK